MSRCQGRFILERLIAFSNLGQERFGFFGELLFDLKPDMAEEWIAGEYSGADLAHRQELDIGTLENGFGNADERRVRRIENGHELHVGTFVVLFRQSLGKCWHKINLAVGAHGKALSILGATFGTKHLLTASSSH